MNKVSFAQFCDDIRQEMTGKHILIGCYGDTMQVKSFPVSLKMSVFASHYCAGGAKLFNGRLSLASGAQLATVKIEVEESPYDDAEIALAQIPVTGLQVNLSRDDELIFEFSADNAKLREIGRLKVELLPPA